MFLLPVQLKSWSIFVWICVFTFIPTLSFANGNVPLNNQLSFEKNEGQFISDDGKTNPSLLYRLRSTPVDLYIKNTGLSYIQHELIENKDSSSNLDSKQKKEIKLNTHRVDIDFVGANPNSKIEESEAISATKNYFLGHCKEGIKGVKSYSELRFIDFYPQIDLVHYVKNGVIEYDFILQPGANPNQIKFEIKGAENWSISEEGNLIITTTTGTITEKAPVVIQEDKIIPSKYTINGSIVSFQIEDYDPLKELRIDPVREWATMIGGAYMDISGNVETDPFSNVYVTGASSSANFPTTPGAQVQIAPSDIFVSKFDSIGNIIWSTYIGGGHSDNGFGLDIDNAGNIAISGRTYSNNFPVTPGGFQATPANTQQDGFIMKLNPAGAIIWSTYYGGNQKDIFHNVSFDNSGNLYAFGMTNSFNFPVSAGASQPGIGGFTDYTLVKFSPTGVRLWATFLGGSSFEGNNFNGTFNYGNVDVDNAGNVFVTGTTLSTNYPATAGAFQTSNTGQDDIVITKFNPAGTIVWSSYFGGTGDEVHPQLDVNDLGNVFLTGKSSSTNLFISPNAYQTTNSGLFSPFYIRLTNNGNVLYSTYFGGFGAIFSSSIVANSNNEIYLSGYTNASTYPVTTDAFQPNINPGDYDLYITKFSNNDTILYSTFYGGSSYDEAYGSTLTDNELYISGVTQSFDFPTSNGAFQTTNNGLYDTYLIKFIFQHIDTENECQFDSIHFSLSDTNNVTNVLWDFGDTASGVNNTSTLLNPSHIYNDHGQYYITCYVVQNNVIDTIVDSLIIHPVAIIDWGNDTVLCEGDSLQLLVNDSNIIYDWSTGDSTWQIQVLAADTYWVAVDNVCGFFSDTIVVDVDTTLEVNIGNDTVLCAGQALQLQSDFVLDDYLWNTGDTTHSIHVTQSGEYILSSTNTCGTFSDSTNVEFINPPDIDLGPDTYRCSSTSITLDAQWDYASYNWNTGSQDSVIVVNQTGSYSVSVTNVCGLDIDSIQIVYDSLEYFSLGNDTTICVGDSILLIAPAQNANWLWNNQSIDSTLWVNTTGTYWVTINNVCGNYTDSINVVVTTQPVLTAIPDTTYCEGIPIEINVAKNNATSISWHHDFHNSFDHVLNEQGTYGFTLSNQCGTMNDTFLLEEKYPLSFNLGEDTILCYGDQILLEIPYPNHVFRWNTGYEGHQYVINHSGTYEVTATTPFGCISTDEIVIEDCDPHLFIPNAFTPNGDGLNDSFEVIALETQDFLIQIFDRWGNLVFVSQTIDNSWNGMYQGKPADEAVYVYRIEFSTGNTYKERYGTVTLVR